MENNKKEVDMNKRKKTNKILIGFLVAAGLFVLLIQIIVSTAPDTEPVDPSLISQSEALVTCLNFYKAQAKYDAKASILGDHYISQNTEKYMIKVRGQIKNAYNVWVKVNAHCEVPFKRTADYEDGFSPANLSYFGFEGLNNLPEDPDLIK